MVFPVVAGQTSNKLVSKLSEKMQQEADQKIAMSLAEPAKATHVRFIVDKIREAGLDVYLYLSLQRDEIICIISASESKLKRFADDYDIKVQLDPTEAKKRLSEGLVGIESGSYIINPVEIPHMPEVTAIPPFEFIYGNYDDDNPDLFYNKDKCFSPVMRTKIIYAILEAPTKRGGAGLEISKLIHFKRLLSIFPMHNKEVADKLLKVVKSFSTVPWTMPAYNLKEYFGESIALNTVFVGHYSLWLQLPAVLGITMQVVVLATDNYSSPVLPFFSVFIAAWGVGMLEFWKRKEMVVALVWGMTDFEAKEPDRPEFDGEYITSFVDGKETLYFAPKEKVGRQFISQTIVAFFVLLVLGTVTSIYVIRFALQSQLGVGASILASVLNTIQITVFNMIYQQVAVKLTDDENHRTDTMYEDSMIVKLFLFQFINSFASFFFLAFIAQYVEAPHGTDSNYRGSCGAPSCMEPLALNLLIIFGTRLTLSNFLDIFLPYLKHQQKIQEETKDVENATLSPAEHDYMLSDYDTIIEGIQTYADSAIQYGFTMMFITALPCASFFSLLSNYIKVKFNLWKLFRLYQRPIPTGAQDIGIWQLIFQFVTGIAVVTNAALVVFTMTVIPDSYSYNGRFWIFVGFQWFMFGVQALFAELVPDEPYEVEVQKDRMRFITSKLIDKTPDEQYSDKQDGSAKGIHKSESVGLALGTVQKGLACCCCVFNRRPKKNMMALDAKDLADLDLKEMPVETTPNPMGYA